MNVEQLIEPGRQLRVVLTAEQWNAVLSIMAEAPAPMRVTSPLVNEIQRQCMQQNNGAPSDYHGSVDARDQRGNGEAQEVE